MFKNTITEKYRVIGDYSLPSLPDELKFAKTDREKAYLKIIKELYNVAQKDPLTGLQHKSHFDTKKKEAGVYIAIDGDGLRELNNTMGHEAGTAGILALSEGIKVSLRTGEREDTKMILDATRSGGDEFIIYVKEVSLATGVTIAKRILDNIRKQAVGKHYTGDASVKAKLDERKLTASLGVGYTQKDADDALYTAKERGRNRVEFFRYVKKVA